MVDVTRPGGTAARAGAGALYTFAGKTGTAQVVAMKQGEKYDEKKVAERHRDHALFVSFAPAENPRIALGILVENGGHGSAHRRADRPHGARLLPARQGAGEEARARRRRAGGLTG